MMEIDARDTVFVVLAHGATLLKVVDMLRSGRRSVGGFFFE